MTDNNDPLTTYECVDPAVGHDLGQLDHPDTDPEFASLLQDHLAICDACRLSRAVAHRLPEALAAPVGARPKGGVIDARRRFRRLGSTWGAAAIAAGLALVMLLPPVPEGAGRLQRGDDAGGFVRPVEGEVVTPGPVTLDWSPIDGATGYRVRVAATDGSFAWEQTVQGTSVSTPAGAQPLAGADLRAYLEPVPADLAPPGGIAVAFRTGSPTAAVLYRLTASHPAARAVLGAGLLAIFGALLAGLPGRR